MGSLSPQYGRLWKGIKMTNSQLGELIPLLMNYREMLEQANARAWSIGGRESAKLREFYSSELKKLNEVLE
jgi:hypothetical protein